MSDMSNFFGGTGPSGFTSYVMYLNSTIFIPQIDMWARVTCVGAGGGGAVSVSTDTTGNVHLAMGGSAGGFVQKILKLSAGTTYTITVGTAGPGGQGINSGSGGITQTGQEGGDTSFSGTGITTVFASGGKAGRASITDPTTDGQVIELLTRTAQGGTGGDIIHKGGVAGIAKYTTRVAADDDIYLATGGAAVNCYGYPDGTTNSGRVEIYQPTYDAIKNATGGAGVGGQSGSVITVSNAASQSDGVTGAGGSISAGVNMTSPTTSFSTGSGAGTGLATLSVLLPQGAGGTSSTNTANVTSGDHGGGGGAVTQGTTTTEAGHGGVFAGGGANASQVYANGLTTGGNGGYGAGGGAVAAPVSSSPTTALAGDGGSGLVYIELLAG